jgi:cytochrome o ubiquinol oxidase subunit 3
MTAATTMDATQISPVRYEERAFGFWLYLMSDVIVFALLFATYVVMLGNTAGGPMGKELFSLERAAGETALLLLSSATFGVAGVALARADKSRALLWLVVTVGEPHCAGVCRRAYRHHDGRHPLDHVQSPSPHDGVMA